MLVTALPRNNSDVRDLCLRNGGGVCAGFQAGVGRLFVRVCVRDEIEFAERRAYKGKAERLVGAGSTDGCRRGQWGGRWKEPEGHCVCHVNEHC